MGKPYEIILNLGSSHVSASKLISKSEKLFLEQHQLIELPVTNNGEQDWTESVGDAIAELSSEHGFKGYASLILPGSIVLSKTLRVPKVEVEKQRKVVEFELSQKLPFPIETLQWDFLVIDDDGIEQEILSFAIKPEVIEKLIRTIFKSGIIPLRFTPGPALDYFSQTESASSGNHLLINFGAKSTNLTFISSSGYLLRSLGLGGAHFTESIAGAFGINQIKAEELKINYTNEAGGTEAKDNTYATIHAVEENFLNKYMQEISRSIVTYKRLKKGQKPNQLIVTGRTIRGQNLLQSLAQSQMLPIKYFDPYAQITASDTIDEDHRSTLPFLTSETIGLANLLFDKSDQKVLNLMPTARLRQLENKKKLPWLFCTAFLLSLIPLPWYLNLLGTEHRLNQERKSLNQQFTKVDKDLRDSLKENASLGLIKSINKAASSYINQLEGLSQKAFSLQEFLNSLQIKLDPKINQNTWIDTFEFIPSSSNLPAASDSKRKVGSSVRISGRYLVKPNELLNELPEEARRLALIEESGRIQEAITSAISEIERVINVSKKTFSIEGKGDLYARQFTHFQFDLELDLLK